MRFWGTPNVKGKPKWRLIRADKFSNAQPILSTCNTGHSWDAMEMTSTAYRRMRSREIEKEKASRKKKQKGPCENKKNKGLPPTCSWPLASAPCLQVHLVFLFLLSKLSLGPLFSDALPLLQAGRQKLKNAGQMDSLVRSRFHAEPTELFTAWQACCDCYQAIRPLSLGSFPSYSWIL